MARLPYPDLTGAEAAPVAERITAERGKMLNLYRMLLHSPAVADGWRAFLTAIRQKATLSDRHRELAILRVAVINRAPYEFRAHIPFAKKGGFTDAEIAAIEQDRMPPSVTAADRSVLMLTDAMTRDVQVPDAVYAAAREHFNAREMVELTATVAAYNLVSRFLEANQVDHE